MILMILTPTSMPCTNAALIKMNAVCSWGDKLKYSLLNVLISLFPIIDIPVFFGFSIGDTKIECGMC